MRSKAMWLLSLTLAACGGSTGSRVVSGFGESAPVAAADGTTQRRLMGQDVLDQPLLPQPGNIWADVLPPTQRGQEVDASPATRGSHPVVAVVPAAAGLPPTAQPIAAAPAPAASRPTALPSEPAVARAPAEPAASAGAAPSAAQAGPPAAARLTVQLAAAPSAQSAAAEWQRLRQHAPGLTDGHPSAVTEAEVNGRHVWRLRAAGFADVAAASAFCSGIRAVKANCWVVPRPASE